MEGFSMSDKEKVKEFIENKRLIKEKTIKEREIELLKQLEYVKDELVEAIGLKKISDDEIFDMLKEVVKHDADKTDSLNLVERLLVLREK